MFAGDGNIYVATHLGGSILRVRPEGAISTVASVPAGHQVRGLTATAGTLVFGDYNA